MFLLSRWSGGLVARYGPRGPLIIGPLITALGFVLFAVPSVGDSYWKTFFPSVIVLGFGMAVTVAPLTTVVMNSVGQDRAGVASGINNAVARVAGVLAVAILGIIMVRAFGFRLSGSLTHITLPSGIVQELEANMSKLAGLQAPADLDERTKLVINQSIGKAFVFAFRIVMLVCAGLALVSAAISWRTIQESRV
jgi:MFS family permease